MNAYLKLFAVSSLSLTLTSFALAGDASSSATAANGWRGNGSAAATANYDGELGFARTRSESGNLSRARGLAVGFDEQGLDVSFSHALASRLGPAYAGTFNVSIGTNGQVNGSYGSVLSTGGLNRSATAGGATSSRPLGGGATAFATGETSPGGHVDAATHSYSVDRRPVIARRPVSVARSFEPHRSVRGGWRSGR